MRKLFTIIILLFLFVSKSNAQTQFPFYGFELSNYEVGDSLEYSGTYVWIGFFSNWSTTLYTIINKEYLPGKDSSIKYTIRALSIETTTNGGNHSSSSLDTFTTIISNAPVYNNDNNIFNHFLDTLSHSPILLDTLGTFYEYYVRFDTINGLKNLSLGSGTHGWNTADWYYDATQNIGIGDWGYDSTQESGWGSYSSFNLVFYHLAHGGIGGQYYKLLDGVQQPTLTSVSAFIQYENNGNAYLVISGSGNYSFQVYDLLGRPVLFQNVVSGNNLINMHTLSRGMYLYKVENNESILGQGKLMNTGNY